MFNMYEASATVLLTLPETTVAIERSLKAEQNTSLAMPPAWEASLAVAMPEKGKGSSPGNPKPTASSIRISIRSGAMPCLVAGESRAASPPFCAVVT